MSDRKTGFGGTLLEMAQTSSSGKRQIKLILHEIYENTTQYNKNGITWLEKYVADNIESATNIPICAQFYDWDKSEPWGHGYTGIKDSMPIFEDSVVVGVVEKAYIDNVDVNGITIRALIGEGLVYEQRYPKFVQWLAANLYDGNMPDGSVEISAKKGNEVIVYESGYVETGRVPMVYDYSGHAILSVEPADDNAVVLELNNAKEEKKVENDKVILELNNKLEDKTNELNSLKNEKNQLDTKMKTLETELNAKEEEITKLTSKVEEQNSKIEENNKKIEEQNTSYTTLEVELNELRTFKKEAENKELVSQLNEVLTAYTDAEKDVAKEKIEAFSASPSVDKIDDIKNEINNNIAQKLLEARKNANNVSEQNSKVDDIYGDVFEANERVTEDDLYK